MARTSGAVQASVVSRSEMARETADAGRDVTSKRLRNAVLEFVQSHPGADAYDIAEALDLGIWEAKAIAEELASVGKLRPRPLTGDHES